MESREVRAIIKQLFSAYPNTQATEGTVAVYVRLLSDIAPAELQTVIDQCIADCKFLPSVAEIRARQRALTRSLSELSATEAWAAVQRQIQSVGSWGSPHFDDDLTARVVAGMGWLNLCQSDKPAVDRAQFLRMYEELAERRQQIDRLLPHARRLVEERTGLRPIGELIRLPTPERN